MSQELNWELSDIFDGGIFAFPVDEPGVARAVVRYLLMRGVLAEEVADAIEQPGSISDLVAWLGGDEKKSMIGVWATAWLNDARRRHDTDRRQRRVIEFRPATAPSVVNVGTERAPDDNGRRSPSPAAVDKRGGGRRQLSLDSDFGGSEDSTSGGSRKGSIEGVCDGSSDHVTTDEDEIGSCALDTCRRSNSDDNVLADRDSTSFPMTSVVTSKVVLRDRHRAARRHGNIAPDRPCSELYNFNDNETSQFDFSANDAASVAFPVPAELCDSGNVSVTTPADSCDCCNRGNEQRSEEKNGDDFYYFYDNDIIAAASADKRRFRFRRQPKNDNDSPSGYRSCGASCRCTLSHYTTSASLQTVICAASQISEPHGVSATSPEVTK